MSTETAAPKSFLTRLFETTSRNKQDGDASDEYASHPAIIADNKKFAKIAVVATVATVTVVALAWKPLSKFAPVEETVETATSED